MQPTTPKFKYDIFATSSLEKLKDHTQQMFDDGWQKASPIIVDGNDYIQEYVKVVVADPVVRTVDTDEFNSKLDKMDQKVKDLLAINNIVLACDNGQLCTYFGDDRADGISPVTILNTLKNSKHVPIDLDEEKVLNEIEGLL